MSTTRPKTAPAMDSARRIAMSMYIHHYSLLDEQRAKAHSYGQRHEHDDLPAAANMDPLESIQVSTLPDEKWAPACSSPRGTSYLNVLDFESLPPEPDHRKYFTEPVNDNRPWTASTRGRSAGTFGTLDRFETLDSSFHSADLFGQKPMEDHAYRMNILKRLAPRPFARTKMDVSLKKYSFVGPNSYCPKLPPSGPSYTMGCRRAPKTETKGGDKSILDVKLDTKIIRKPITSHDIDINRMSLVPGRAVQQIQLENRLKELSRPHTASGPGAYSAEMQKRKKKGFGTRGSYTVLTTADRMRNPDATIAHEYPNAASYFPTYQSVKTSPNSFLFSRDLYVPPSDGEKNSKKGKNFLQKNRAVSNQTVEAKRARIQKLAKERQERLERVREHQQSAQTARVKKKTLFAMKWSERKQQQHISISKSIVKKRWSSLIALATRMQLCIDIVKWRRSCLARVRAFAWIKYRMKCIYEKRFLRKTIIIQRAYRSHLFRKRIDEVVVRQSRLKKGHAKIITTAFVQLNRKSMALALIEQYESANASSRVIQKAWKYFRRRMWWKSTTLILQFEEYEEKKRKASRDNRSQKEDQKKALKKFSQKLSTLKLQTEKVADQPEEPEVVGPSSPFKLNLTKVNEMRKMEMEALSIPRPSLFRMKSSGSLTDRSKNQCGIQPFQPPKLTRKQSVPNLFFESGLRSARGPRERNRRRASTLSSIDGDEGIFVISEIRQSMFMCKHHWGDIYKYFSKIARSKYDRLRTLLKERRMVNNSTPIVVKTVEEAPVVHLPSPKLLAFPTKSPKPRLLKSLSSAVLLDKETPPSPIPTKTRSKKIKRSKKPVIESQIPRSDESSPEEFWPFVPLLLTSVALDNAHEELIELCGLDTLYGD